MGRSAKNSSAQFAKVRRRQHLLEALEQRANPATYSFAGSTFEQDSTPDVLSVLTPGTYTNAIVTQAPTGTASITNFPSASAGFNSALGLGHVLNVTGLRAVNLPNGNQGNLQRSGIEISWSNNRLLPNTAGDDFVIYESGTVSPVGSKTPEAYMIQVFNTSTSGWSSWYYTPADASAQYGGTGAEGAFATRFDLTDLGVGSSDYVSKVRIVNMTPKDRMLSSASGGFVIPEDNGATSTIVPSPGSEASFPAYGNSTFDPDPLYLGVFGSLYLNLTVDSTSDVVDADYSAGNFSLREAVTLANNVAGANTITFAPGLAGSTITLGSELAVTDDLTITGLGADQLTISGNNNSRIFNIDKPSGAITVNISGLTLTAGKTTAVSPAAGGGAIYNAETLNLDAVEVTNSTATASSGGAIWNAGTLQISRSYLAGGSAAVNGGAILNAGALTIVNSSLAGNSAAGSGGAIENQGTGTVTIANGTLVGNLADSDNNGGAFTLDNQGGAFVLRNTLVVGSLVGVGVSGSDVSSGISGSNNIIGDATSSGSFVHGVNGNIVGNSGSGTLAANSVVSQPFTNNGGPTRTAALVPGGLAIDAGDNTYATANGLSGGTALTTDQRGAGFARVLNGTVDIGAYEQTVSPANLGVSVAANSSTVHAGSEITYTITVTNTGLGSAKTVNLEDVIPTGTTFVSFTQTSGPTFLLNNPSVGGTGTAIGTLSSLAPNATAVFELVVKVPANATAGSTISNTAVVSTTSADTSTANDSSATTTAVDVLADLTTAISASPATAVSGGQNITYTFSVSNNGVSDATTVHLSDELPAGTTFVSLSQLTGPTFALSAPNVGSGGTVTADLGRLAALSSASFELTVHVAASQANGSTITNAVTVTSAASDPNSSNDSAQSVVNVASAADVGIVVSTQPVGSVVAGTPVTYTITIDNAGPSDAFDTILDAAVPVGAKFVSLQQTSGTALSLSTPPVGGTGSIQVTGTLAASSAASFEFVVISNSSLVDGSSLEFTGSVSTSASDSHSANDSAIVSNSVAVSADLGVTMTANPAGTASAGTNITYTITVTNDGPSDAAAISLLDSLPADVTFVSLTQLTGPSFVLSVPTVGTSGDVTASRTTLFPNEAATFELVVLVSSSAADGLVIENSATVSAFSADPSTANDSATTSTTVAQAADISVALSASPATTVIAGNEVTYEITVNNGGPGVSLNVSFADAIPAGMTFVSFAQLTGPTFLLTAPNVGETGTIAAEVASLPANSAATFQLVLHVLANVADGATLDNTVDLTSATSDPTPENNSRTVSLDVSQSADLDVSMTAVPVTVAGGQTITYHISASSAGPSDVAGLLSTVTPEGTTFVSFVQNSGPTATIVKPSVGASGNISVDWVSFNAAATAEFTFVVKVNANITDGGTITANAVVSSSADTNTANDQGSADVDIVNSANVEVVLSDSPDPVIAGNTLTYQITVTNYGPSDARDVAWSDQLPAGTTFVSLTPMNLVAEGFTRNELMVGSTGTVSANIAALPPLNQAIFQLTVLVGSDVPATTDISNTASVATTTADAISDNNSAQVATIVTTQADLGVAVSATPETVVTAGNTISYAFTVTNDGPSDAANAHFTFALPAGTTFLSTAAGSGTQFVLLTPDVGSAGTITGDLASLPVGSTTFTVVVRVPANTAGGTLLEATANVSTDTNDANSVNDSAQANSAVESIADLQLSVTATPETVSAGGDVTYTITLFNDGTSDAATVLLSDVLPAGMTFVSFTQTSGPAFVLTTPAVGGTGTVTASASSFSAAGAATARFTLVLRIDSTFTGNSIANTVTVTSTSTDPSPNDNSETTTTAISTASPGQFLIAFDPPSGTWYGSHLSTGHSRIVAQFGANQGWRDGIVADFNGDGVSDLAARNGSGRWFVAIAQPGQANFYTAVPWSLTTNRAFEKVQVADVNNDGRDDIVAYSRAAGSNWYVFKTNAAATNFTTQVVKYNSRFAWTDFVVADFTGDGRTDFAARISTTNPKLSTWFVSTANESGTLAAGKVWGQWAGLPWKDVRTADYNGDGKVDIVGRDRATGTWRLAQSTGAKFLSRDLGRWQKDALAKWQNVIIADLNGDGKDDIAGQNSQGYWLWIHQNGAQNVFANKFGRWLPSENYKSVFAADLDHDGRDEIFGRRGTTGVWRIDRLNTTNGKLQNIVTETTHPTWNKNVDWMFAAIGEDESGNLF